MLPLGDMWDGVCHANSESPWTPDESTLVSHCNLGYARGCCARFPSTDGPDAARFTIVGDVLDSIRIYYVLEHDHHPWEHGTLEYSRAAKSFTAGSAPESTRGLAHAYVASYLRRISEASVR